MCVMILSVWLSLSSVNRPVFVTELEYVFREEETEILNITSVDVAQSV
jgi:hypothetical protein